MEWRINSAMSLSRESSLSLKVLIDLASIVSALCARMFTISLAFRENSGSHSMRCFA